MNILLLNWRDPKNPKSGGAEYVTMRHAAYWANAGHDVTWFASSFSSAPEEEVINGVRIIRKHSGLRYFFEAFRFYQKSKHTIDIVVDEVHGVPFLTPLYVKCPIVVFIHEVAGEIWDYSYPFPLNTIGKMAERYFLYFYRGRQFWTDAQSMIDDLVRVGIKRAFCHAIPCPIDIQPLRNPEKKEDKPTFLFVGRIVRMKGVADAVVAFSTIQKKYTNARLWIVGTGERKYEKILREQVYSLGLERHVIFFGYVSEEKKIRLLHDSHLLLHPSVTEGWGLVVLEAGSQATPTVGYDVPGLRDTVVDNKTGLLVNRDPEKLAEAALRLYEDKKLYRRMQRACLSYVASFSWDTATRASLALLTSQVENGKLTAR